MAGCAAGLAAVSVAGAEAFERPANLVGEVTAVGPDILGDLPECTSHDCLLVGVGCLAGLPNINILP